MGTLISVSEYLSTTYRPDCDYIEGVVQERNVGEYDHSRTQGLLCAYLFFRESQFGLHFVAAQRVQIKADRFRVPDICAILQSAPVRPIFTDPPFLCVEILSKDDEMTNMMELVHDYLEMGVPWIWLLDPRTRRAWIHTQEAMYEVKDGTLRTSNPDVTVPLNEVFPEQS